MSQLKYWLWLSLLSGYNTESARTLLRHFGTPEKVYSANAEDYKAVEGIRPPDVHMYMDKNLEPAVKTLESCAETGCRVVRLHDAEYPDRLRNIYDPPIILYVKGTLPAIDDEPAVALVGTRDCTSYGYKAAENIGRQLARRGLIVVTGLAKGIDTAAARGALQAGGLVIGVIGSGIDIVYPSENKALFAEVASSGAILSEYPPGMAAKPAHFPARNRIISGLSLGVAVIEAPKRSGALITAARALEQGRDVFALPGNVGARSCEGSNLLLREGAIPILSGEDIIGEYAELFPGKILADTSAKKSPEPKERDRQPEKTKGGNVSSLSGKKESASQSGKKEIDNISGVEYIDLGKMLDDLAGDERLVAETIGNNAIHADDIISGSGLPAAQVLTALTMLEIKGCAAQHDGLWRLTVFAADQIDN